MTVALIAIGFCVVLLGVAVKLAIDNPMPDMW